MSHEAPEFRVGSWVAYKGEQYQIVAAQVMGVTGWRYCLQNESRRVNWVWPHELS